MAEELKELIEKIKEEGIEAAEKKAREIESQALAKADEIIADAKERAQDLLAEARAKVSQTEASTKALLSQAARDLLLSLRKELNAMLERLIISELNSMLGASDLERIITEIVRAQAQRPNEDKIIISLKKSDLEILEKKFLSKLKEETKKGIILKPSLDIRAGFTISFDKGKSCYDFTDRSLAEYIGRYLKPKLNEILTAPTPQTRGGA